MSLLRRALVLMLSGLIILNIYIGFRFGLLLIHDINWTIAYGIIHSLYATAFALATLIALDIISYAKQRRLFRINLLVIFLIEMPIMVGYWVTGHGQIAVLIFILNILSTLAFLFIWEIYWVYEAQLYDLPYSVISYPQNGSKKLRIHIAVTVAAMFLAAFFWQFGNEPQRATAVAWVIQLIFILPHIWAVYYVNQQQSLPAIPVVPSTLLLISVTWLGMPFVDIWHTGSLHIISMLPILANYTHYCLTKKRLNEFIQSPVLEMTTG